MNPGIEERIRALERPDPALWKYYQLAALPTLLFPPLFLVVLFLAWVRYSTLRYTFTQEGVSMKWGRLPPRDHLELRADPGHPPPLQPGRAMARVEPNPGADRERQRGRGDDH